ncbi:MAG: efflux RND transporter periplasmic adaptor subunit [Helicobacteraceae bacterium]|nr:efflux RND transporter periplasmic adaptor subunit [Helicobacteraceae bacterium]
MNDVYSNIKRQKTNKSKLIFIAIAVIAIIVIFIFVWLRLNKKEEVYITQTPVLQDISQDVSATGTLSPTDTVEVGSQISGILLEVLVDVNDEVKKGQTIAIIDPEKLNQSVDNFVAQLQSAKAELYSAEVQLENKQWNYENYLNLYEKTNGKSPSQMQLKTSELEYKNAKADIEIRKAAIAQIETSLKSARIDVKNSIITSPTNGIVLSRSIDPGQTVAASFSAPTLFVIAKDLKEMKLISNVLEADIGKVKVGQDVIFSVDSYPNEEFNAKIAKVNYADSSSTSSSSSSSSSGTSSSSTNIVSYEVTTYIKNDKLLLRPGMSATATIKTEVQKNALVVPYQALLFQPNNNSVKKNSGGFIMGGPPKKERKSYSQLGSIEKIWILENGIPKEIEVEIGISNGKNVQIISNNIDTNTQVILQVQTK